MKIFEFELNMEQNRWENKKEQWRKKLYTFVIIYPDNEQQSVMSLLVNHRKWKFQETRCDNASFFFNKEH